MKAYIVQSPCYKANGLHGSYYSLVFANESGDIIKGFGNHISTNEYGITNVFKAEGQSFSDSDRILTTKEVDVSESAFDNFVNEYKASVINSDTWDKAREKRFGIVYYYIWGEKLGQEKREAEYNTWLLENPPVSVLNYYSFLDLVPQKS